MVHFSNDNLPMQSAVVKRAFALTRKHKMPYSKQDISMDIAAAHFVCPLRLRELLEADDFNFAHDIFGIMRHLNRETGELDDFFLPRFAA